LNLNDVPHGVDICVELTPTVRTTEVIFDHLFPLALFELHTFKYEDNRVDLLRPSGGWSLHTHQGDEQQQILTT